VIVGGIDGFSRLPVMLACTNNNKSQTLLSCFLDAISEYVLPSRVRTDKGLENVLIADLMIEKRGNDRGSIITGPSTHNQRIERLWRDVFQGVLSYYYHLFYFLEDQLVLDPLNDKHIAALHHTYMDEINSNFKSGKGHGQITECVPPSPARLDYGLLVNLRIQPALTSQSQIGKILELKAMLTSKMTSKKDDQYFLLQYWNLVKTTDLNLLLLFHMEIITK
jgi:hypothetical protein